MKGKRDKAERQSLCGMSPTRGHCDRMVKRCRNAATMLEDRKYRDHTMTAEMASCTGNAGAKMAKMVSFLAAGIGNTLEMFDRGAPRDNGVESKSTTVQGPSDPELSGGNGS